MGQGKPRIKIEDLPKDTKISKEQMKAVFGGYYAPPIFSVPELGPMGGPKLPPIELGPVVWHKLKELPSVYGDMVKSMKKKF
jgi:hypothetical protein